MDVTPTREEVVRRAMLPSAQGNRPAMSLAEFQDERRLIHLGYRIRRLPEQIATARNKLARLEAEARELGMYDLVEGGR